MAVSKPMKQQDVALNVYDDAVKIQESSGGRVLKKASLVWKLVMLALVGACGIYMCFVGVDQKISYEKLSLDPIQHWTASEYICPRFSRLPPVEFAQHYPQPHSYSRNECICNPVHYFVILSMQRSGSGWFETLLNSHQNISSHGEVFSVRPRRQNFTAIQHTLDTIYNLDWYSSAAKNECTAAVGFKWMLNQGAMEYSKEVATYFRRRSVSVILLLRRNSLKRLISILGNAYDRAKPLNGTHVAHVHTKEEAEKLASYKPTIDTNSLVENLRRVQEISKDAMRMFNSTRLTVLYYEDLVRNPEQNVNWILQFLGVAEKRLESKHVKIHTRPLSDLITNSEHVYRTLNGTEFDKFLQDDDYL